MNRVHVVLLAAGLLLSGCAGSKFAPLEKIPGEAHIDGGGGYELNFDLDGGDIVTWSWESDGQLDFDVHSHQGSQVVTHHERNFNQDSGQFTARTEGTYSLYWTNPGTMPVHLTYELHTDGKQLA